MYTNEMIHTTHSEDEIAIIGMAGRFPLAADIEEFWQNLKDGKECISDFSDEELKASGINTSLLSNPNYVRRGGMIKDADLFDASFFGYSPSEAVLTDPQHRIFLECAWEAIENAGYNPEKYKGMIGVYAGCSMNNYILNNLLRNRQFIDSMGSFNTVIGNDKDYLTTRISYKLNLNGPSINIQCACSTSLVAVVLACQSLLDYQCDMALAGGVSLKVPQKTGYLYQEGMIHSPDGYCRAFDIKAQGTVPGEGMGIVVLKRLDDALEDGDTIHAIIKGSAINNDGSVKIGYTAPSIEGQASVIALAHAAADVKPDDISYIEAHGTGTSLGDSIEIAALTKVFRAYSQKKSFCAIGSVKTNIGHVDIAAGVTSVIKTTLALKNKIIPATLHFEKANPKLELSDSPFYVHPKTSPWENPHDQKPRLAGVSSFGIGGTNAHVVLEEAPSFESSSSKPYHLLLISARTKTALNTATLNLLNHLKRHPDMEIADVAYTLQIGRKDFNYRRFIFCKNYSDALKKLESLDKEQTCTGESIIDSPSMIFIFTGQGSQYINTGPELYRTESVFREQIDYCSNFLKPYLGLDLRDIMYPKDKDIENTSEQSAQTLIVQSAHFILEYALAKLLIDWGILPQAMIGDSIGEYAAACIAGVLTLDEALKLIYEHGCSIQNQPSGAMPIHLNKNEIKPQPPLFPFISNISGTWITKEEATNPDYWIKHLHQDARLTDIVSDLMNDPDKLFIEIGQDNTLSSLINNTTSNQNKFYPVTHSLSINNEHHDSDYSLLLKTLGRLWCNGARINWSLYRNERRYRIPLPSYPFERQRYWVEPLDPDYSASGKLSEQSILKEKLYGDLYKRKEINDWLYIPSWRRSPLQEFSNVELNDRKKNNLSAENEKCWLVFCDSNGIGSKLAKDLKCMNHNIISVYTGDKYKSIDVNSYNINPNIYTNYFDLLKSIKTSGMVPEKIIHLWSLTPNYSGITNTSHSSSGTARELIDQAQDMGFFSLINLVQALEHTQFINPIYISIISNKLHKVLEEDVINPEKTTILSLSKIIPQEYPNINCHNIDIALPSSHNLQEITDLLLKEICTNNNNRLSFPESMIAYREGKRWIQTYNSLPLKGQSETPHKLKEKGVYLITGGLEGAGLAIAEYLLQRYNVRLIITYSLSLIDNKNDEEISSISQFLHTRNEQMIHSLRKFEKIEEEILCICAEESDEIQMKSVITQAIKKFGTINGVIHTQRVLEEMIFSSISEINREKIEQNFKSRMLGMYVIEKALEGHDLDFCLIASSLSSILGGIGTCVRSSVNNFIDAFVHWHNKTKPMQWICVNWDRWHIEGEIEDNYGDVKSIERLSMTEEEGTYIFNSILSSNFNDQIIVSITNIEDKLKFWNKDKPSEEIKVPPENIPSPDRSEYIDHIPLKNDIEQIIAETWQDFLGINHIDTHDNFFDLGGDSLLATGLIAKLRSKFQIDLPLRAIFEDPTIAGMAKNINFDFNKKIYQYNSKSSEWKWVSLIPMQPRGSRPPFFLVAGAHADEDEFLRYLSNMIPHIGLDQPIYGFKPRGLDGITEPHTSVEDMARDYITEMRSFSPIGPYYIGGECIGGNIAWEIAQQLYMQGEDVGILVLMDTPRPTPYYILRLRIETILQKPFSIARRLRSHISKDIKGSIKNIIGILKKKQRILFPVQESEKIISHLKKVEKQYVTSISSYRPKEYPGKLTYLVNEEQAARNLTMNWRPLPKGGLEIHVVPGNHISRLTKYGKIVADKLYDCLDRAQLHNSKKNNYTR